VCFPSLPHLTCPCARAFYLHIYAFLCVMNQFGSCLCVVNQFGLCVCVFRPIVCDRAFWKRSCVASLFVGLVMRGLGLRPRILEEVPRIATLFYPAPESTYARACIDSSVLSLHFITGSLTSISAHFGAGARRAGRVRIWCRLPSISRPCIDKHVTAATVATTPRRGRARLFAPLGYGQPSP
jgi:hypothetical protein